MAANVYILSNRPNGTLYVGVTRNSSGASASIEAARFPASRGAMASSGWCISGSHDDIRTAIQRERNMKHWPRAWKVRLIHADNPEWRDLFEDICK
jgi:putative endonuclease